MDIKPGPEELQIIAYKMAMTELGLKELEGPRANEKILEAFSFTSNKATSDEVPWCSAMMNRWICKFGGLTGTYDALARSWLSWGVAIKDPRPADIVIFKR